MLRTLAGAWITWRALRVLRRLLAIAAIAGAITLIADHHSGLNLGSLESLGRCAQGTVTRLLEHALSRHPAAGAAPATRRLGALGETADCVGQGPRPDPRRTPGAVRTGVSLAALCAAGSSRRVRPPESYTEPLKLAQMRAYHRPGRASGYKQDHLVAIAIGGAARDPANLWPQPRTGALGAGAKDVAETWAARTACSHRIALGQLQRDFARDWIRVYRQASRP